MPPEKSTKRSSGVPSSPKMLVAMMGSRGHFVVMSLGFPAKASGQLSGLPSLTTGGFANGSIFVGENVVGSMGALSGVNFPN